MQLINFPYANCHLLCLINIAAMLNKNYQNAFATLWSETDFTENDEYQIYISKSVFKNLKAIGIKIKTGSYDLIKNKDFFIVGMDTFYIPWSPVYQNFHGNHYFIAQKDDADFVTCFDPIYNKKNVKIKLQAIVLHAFEICSVTKTSAKPWLFKIENEAKAALRSSLKMQKHLCPRIEGCKNQNAKTLVLAIKQTIALICNRYMFKSFLLKRHPQFCHFFNEDYFDRWHAVKNGLYKASTIKDNASTLDEVSILLKNLLKEEAAAAKIILNSFNKKIVH